MNEQTVKFFTSLTSVKVGRHLTRTDVVSIPDGMTYAPVRIFFFSDPSKR